MKEFSEDLIWSYLQNTTSREENELINQWLGESEENKRWFCSLKAVHAVEGETEHARKHLLDKEFKSLQKKIEASGSDVEKEKSVPVKRLYLSGFRKYAAVLLLAILSVAGVFIYQYSRGTQSDYLVASVSHDGDIKVIFLPDGSTVWLNNSSQLRYPENFSQKTRNVYLEGEAYFDVKKDAEKPFIVTSSSLQVTVKGTKFDFRSSEEDLFSSVVLDEGSIEILQMKENILKDQRKSVILLPNQLYVLNKKTGEFKVEEVENDFHQQWITGSYSFTSTPLEKVLEQLERSHGVHVVTQDSPLKQTLFTGGYKRSDSIEMVLNSISLSLGLEYRQEGDTVYFKNRP